MRTVARGLEASQAHSRVRKHLWASVNDLRLGNDATKDASANSERTLDDCSVMHAHWWSDATTQCRKMKLHTDEPKLLSCETRPWSRSTEWGMASECVPSFGGVRGLVQRTKTATYRNSIKDRFLRLQCCHSSNKTTETIPNGGEVATKNSGHLYGIHCQTRLAQLLTPKGMLMLL